VCSFSLMETLSGRGHDGAVLGLLGILALAMQQALHDVALSERHGNVNEVE
jgi:hypothetical protein